MPDSLLKISGGYLYDPANNIDGQAQDLWVQGGKIVAAPSDPSMRATHHINAAGMVIMPGGIDMHCHIAGPKANVARKMRPEERRGEANVFESKSRNPKTQVRSGTLGSVPSTFVTGYKYAGMGYTSAFDAAVPPLAARHVHEEFADTPCIDKGFYVLLGNNEFILQAIRDRQPERAKAFIAWLLGAAKGYGAKLVNPGGVEQWKQQARGNVHTLDDSVGYFDVTPRQIIREVASAADDLALPHSVHIHANNLGLPGNWRTTLETMRALEGRRGHLTHIQFHSYAGGDGDETTFGSRVAQLADFVNSHPNITVDVGQVLFGNTTSMTGDGPLGYYLANVYGTKWFSIDTELESGCGIAPIKYKNTSLVHAWQWAIGLEWYLLVNDPWRIAMSTDHPNGGAFLAYPQIIRLLMDRTYRRDVLKTVNEKVAGETILKDHDREYTLNEIAIITRAGPARMLGLKDKGHLGIGADADITIYTPHENKERMFELPRYVLKAGEILIEDGEIRAAPTGHTLHTKRDYDRDIERQIADWFEQYYSVGFANYAVALDE